MSAETIEYLNANTLIGFTESDGNAWHWDGITQNQYPGAIPVDDIEARLFNWRAEFRTPMFDPEPPSSITDDTPSLVHWDGDLVTDPATSAVVRVNPDGTLKVFNYVTDTYRIHQYPEWLLHNVANLVDQSSGELDFGSAVLLKDGAVAAVQVRPPEMVRIGDDQYLKYILAVTSHNSQIATTYKVVYQRVVCDNTLDIAMTENSPQFRVKHTTNSSLLVAEARQALDIMFTGMTQFDTEIERLMNTQFTTNQFAGAIRFMWPQPEVDLDPEGNVSNQRAINNWDRRFDELWAMWNTDPRVGTYKNTAWGGLMAFNTWNQWGMAERETNSRDIADVKHSQFVGTITGDIAQDDRKWIRAMNMAMA